MILTATVNCSSQETEVTSTPTRLVENVVITTEGLQDRNNLILDGRTVENKGKLILNVECTAVLLTLSFSDIVLCK